MCDNNHCFISVTAKCSDDIHYQTSIAVVQSVKRFVQNNKGRVLYKGACQQYHSLFSTGNKPLFDAGIDCQIGGTIGLSVSTLNNPFFVSLAEGAESAAKANGVDIAVVDAGDDVTKQVSDIEDLVSKGISVLILNPCDSDAVTGAVDSISNGKQGIVLNNGHPLLEDITGSGCMTSTLCACCAAVTKDMVAAAALGVVVLGQSAELAANFLEKKDGPGMFKVRLVDAVYHVTTKWNVINLNPETQN